MIEYYWGRYSLCKSLLSKIIMLNKIGWWLLVIGGLNWGLVGFFQWDLVAKLLGSGDPSAMLPRVVYALVGLAAVWSLFTMGSMKK